MFDRVDLVGSWERDSKGNGNFVWLGNVFDLDKLTGKGTWDSNMDINVVLVWTTVIAGAHTRGEKGESPSLAKLTATHPWGTARQSEKTASLTILSISSFESLPLSFVIVILFCFQ